jgi:hypothetical protein
MIGVSGTSLSETLHCEKDVSGITSKYRGDAHLSQVLVALVLEPSDDAIGIRTIGVLEQERAYHIPNGSRDGLEVFQLGRFVAGPVPPTVIVGGMIPISDDKLDGDGFFEVLACVGGLATC